MPAEILVVRSELRIPSAAAQARIVSGGEFWPANGNYHNISTTWLAHGLSTALDELFTAPGDEEVAVFVHSAQVSGAQPAVDKILFVLRAEISISAYDARPQPGPAQAGRARSG